MGLFDSQSTPSNSNANIGTAGNDLMGDLLAPMGSMGMISTPQVQQAFLSPAGFASTADFGSRWGSHSAEAKVQINGCSVGSPEDFMNVMQQKVGIQPIEAIQATAEAICAGKNNAGAFCLVHGKVVGMNALLVTVRSQDASYSQKVVTFIETCLKN